MSFNVEKYRIIISRIAAAAALLFLFICDSHWMAENKLFTSFMFVAGIVFAGAASLGRMWCSLYIAGYKDEKLITKGPYSICRNPLYFFSMVGVTGIGLCTGTLTFPALFLLLFSIYYPFVIKREEKRLKSIFGTRFSDYTRKVPAFIPNPLIFEEPDNYTVNPSVYRVHIFSALWFIWVIGIFEVVRAFKKTGMMPPVLTLY